MNKKDFSLLLKKCFGKEKNDRYHAIAMLIIYGIFILIIVLMIRLDGTTNTNTNKTPDTTSNPNETTSPNTDTNNDKENEERIIGNDINYSYSYTITLDNSNEVYLGKKIDEKEKFTLIKDGQTTNYAIIDDNYLVLENNKYRIASSPSDYFKYCDVSNIFSLIENEDSIKENNTITYSISNKKASTVFRSKLINDNEQLNTIKMYIPNNSLKTIDLVLSNYFSSLKGEGHTLIIHMEFVDIGTTENFNIDL